MSIEDRAAGENILYLEQGIALVQFLDDDSYRGAPSQPFPGGVGAQLRHCLDFYDCLLAGVARGVVDYGARLRDARIETDRGHAVERMGRIIEGLEGLSSTSLDLPLLIPAEGSPVVENAGPAAGSTLRRELQFLVSHTIHHYALVVALLRLQGTELGPEFARFGVAPSTLRHWSRTQTTGG